MTQLPADRTKLALAQDNQIPSKVSSAQRNINAMTEAYDTIDLLNQKVNDNNGAGSTGTSKIADSSVTTPKLAPLAVTTAKLAEASVTLSKMAVGSVGTGQLVDSSITAAKVMDGVLTAAKFVADALTNDTQNGLRITALEVETVTGLFNVVKGYGCDPTGKTDSKTKFQAAIDAAADAGGGVVFIPSNSEILISSSLSLRSNVVVIGQGHTSVIKTATPNIQIFTLSGSGEVDSVLSKIGFDNFKIINSGDISSNQNSHCINMYDAKDSYVKNMWLENSKGDGLYIRDCDGVDVSNIYCKNTRRQGIAVTKADNIRIDHIRGFGEMINLVDIEPNIGDKITNLYINDVVLVSDTAEALRFLYGAATYDIITNVIVTNIHSKTLVFQNITNLIASNLILESSESYDSLLVYVCKNVEISNVEIIGVGVSRTKLNVNSVTKMTLSNINIEGGGNIDVDLNYAVNTTINALKVENVGNIGVRVRDCDRLTFNDIYVEDASTYAMYLVPTVSNSNIVIKGISVPNCSGTGIQMDKPHGNVVIEGDLSGATTPYGLGGSFTGEIIVTNLLGVRKVIYGSNAAPTANSHLRGDEIVNGFPAIGHYSRFICTAAGTPGIWVGIGQVGAIKNTTANRPVANIYAGYMYLDTTLAVAGKPVWYTGSAWVDALGNVV